MILFSISTLGEFHDSASSLCSFDLPVSCPCCCALVCASGHYGKMWKHLIPFWPRNVESWLFYISYTILVRCSLLPKMSSCMNIAIGFYQRFILSHMYLFGRWRSDALWATLLRMWLHSLARYVKVLVVEIPLQFHRYLFGNAGTQGLSHWPGSWSLINFCVFWGYSTKLLSLRFFFHWQAPCRMQVLFCHWFLKQSCSEIPCSFLLSLLLSYRFHFRVFPVSVPLSSWLHLSFHLLYS